jgi:hypothetical protein
MTQEHPYGINFDELPVTTMTAHIYKKEGKINIPVLFWLIPWDEMKHSVSLLSRSKKLKLKNDVPCGNITSLRCNGITRGLERIVKKSNKSYFQNCITIDLGTGVKSVCVKLFSGSIHICGAKSEEMCKTAANIIVEKLTKILSFMNDWEKYKEDIDQYVKNLYNRGENTFRYTEGKVKFKIAEKTIVPPDDDTEVARFFNPLVKDYEYVSQFANFISFLNKNHKVGDLPYALEDEIKITMTNFDYKLPWSINRKELNKELNEGLNEGVNNIFSRYNNGSESAVFVEIPHEKISKTGKNMHTFMIRKSGTVTQSGPRREMIKEAFLIFMDKLKKIEEKVFKKK